jgi:hypothetical protein
MILEFLMAYGQYPMWVGGLSGLFLFAFIAAAIVNGLTNPKYKGKHNWDLFKLGEIYDEPYYRPTPTNLMRAVDSDYANATATAVDPERGAKDNPIYNDCVLALRSLGYTARDAKNTSEQILETHSIDSVEEFVPIALSKRP